MAKKIVKKAAVKKAVAKAPAKKAAVKKTVAKAPAKKAAVKKAVAKAPAKKAAVKKAVAKAPAKKAAVKKAVAKAPAKKAAVKKAVAKAPAKKAAVKKAVAKAPAKKAAVKKAVAKAPAKKAAVKKVAPQKSVVQKSAPKQSPRVEAPASRVRYSDEDLKFFKELILDKLSKAKEDYEMLRKALSNSDSFGVEDTSPSFSSVEEGASSLIKEENGLSAHRLYKYIESLEKALVRIENKTYGISRLSGKLIPKERLILVPHATLTAEEKNNR